MNLFIRTKSADTLERSLLTQKNGLSFDLKMSTEVEQFKGQCEKQLFSKDRSYFSGCTYNAVGVIFLFFQKF